MFGPLATVAAAVAAWAVQPAGLSGLWEGTVGDLPVRACFAGHEWGAFGAYYYRSRRQLIPLEAEEGAAGAFRERDARDPASPRWRIERADAGALRARWTGGGRTLAIRLARVAHADGEPPCVSLEFHRPRLEGVRAVVTRASVDGVAYSRIALDHGGRFDASFETFALDGASEPVRRLNATLGEALAGDPPEWFECVRAPLAHGSSEGGFSETLAPAMISSRWLAVVHAYDSFCGGAHPSHGRIHRTFDLAAGREIDLHDWFNEAAVRRERLTEVDSEIRTLQPAFRSVILAGWSAGDPECDEVVRSAEFWNIGLTREALILAPDLPHVAQACGDEFALPFDRLRPFLTERGAANLRALQAEGPSR